MTLLHLFKFQHVLVSFLQMSNLGSIFKRGFGAKKYVTKLPMLRSSLSVVIDTYFGYLA